MDILQTITELSHEFGGDDYVKGGGGNTSCKDDQTLWVKPSGTTLAGLRPGTFVAINRAKINALYNVQTPERPAAREELVKNVMADAVVPGSTGRPSVEAPLHNVFEAVFVVHTHPALVNGMTCAENGAAVCAELFPDALWIGYIDPGYTLCMHVRSEIQTYRTARGREPSVLFLENHGVFIAGNTADEIRERYAVIMQTLRAAYRQAGVSTELAIGPAQVGPATAETLRGLLGTEAEGLAVSGPFTLAEGPVSPDHIVYSKSYPFTDALTVECLDGFRLRHGYLPRVLKVPGGVCGAGATQKTAELALLLAQDGALVRQLTDAFGGVRFMSDAARSFIENWEVESYRAKQAQ